MNANRRLENLILFICEECEDPRELGAVKLNKILWFSDVFAYRFTGKSLSQSDYIKLQYGPVPKSAETAIEKLKDDGRLIVREDKVMGYSKKTFINTQKADLSEFSSDELKLVSVLTREICKNHTATSVSELSHDVVWEAAAMGETIPLSATLVSEPATITEDDKAWALQAIADVEAP